MPLMSPRFAGDPQLQAAANNSPPLKIGSSGQGVKLLQKALLHFGHDMPLSTAKNKKPPDGIYGKETAATVRRFQGEQAVFTDGVAGRDTLTRLDTLLVADDAQARVKLVIDAARCSGSSGRKA